MSIELYPAPASPSTPQAPSWAYTSGTIGAGKFTTNNASISNTTSLVISDTAIDGGASWISYLVQNVSGLLMTGPNGTTYFRVTAGSSVGGNATLTVAIISGIGAATLANWSGNYAIIPLPGIAELQAAAGITPDADGTTTPVTSVTTKAGIVTAVS